MPPTGERRRGPGEAHRDGADGLVDGDTRPSDEQALDALRTLRAWLGVETAPMADPLVLLEQVPSLFAGVTKGMAYDAARTGQLVAIKIGRKPAARRSDIAAWVESRRMQPRLRKATEPPTDDPEAAYLELVNGGAR
jgi:hypothetical protein